MCPDFDPFPKLKEPLRGEGISVFKTMECSDDRRNNLTPVVNQMEHKNYQSFGKLS
jgi:hypothetical protein